MISKSHRKMTLVKNYRQEGKKSDSDTLAPGWSRYDKIIRGIKNESESTGCTEVALL